VFVAVLFIRSTEREYLWHSSLGNLSSVNIVSDDDHLPWILAHSAVVHSGSTTGLEAIILGRDGINICVEDSAGHECFIPSGMNINAKNADEAVAAVERELFKNRALKRKN
jgi:hypothetical protein